MQLIINLFTVVLIVGGKVSVDSAARKIQSASSHKYGVIVRIRGGRNQQFTENVLVSLFQEYRVSKMDKSAVTVQLECFVCLSACDS